MFTTIIKCMKNNKPLVSILLAIYNPYLEWFEKQLISLNNQDYDNIELIVIDDCSKEIMCNEEFISKFITNFSFNFIKSDVNIGSNKTFEKLTNLANGKYISYCDQDDIWCGNKISMMVDELEKTNSNLVCSDLFIIDKNEKIIANSITKVRKRHVFREGENLTQYLVISNFATGCAMMVKTDIAKSSIPFEETLIHDHWITLWSSIDGSIVFINRPLVYYRQHNNNQTGILSGVFDKKTYFNLRIMEYLNRSYALETRLKNIDEKEALDTLNDYKFWLESRKNYFIKPNKQDFLVMKKYIKFGIHSVILESILHLIPNFIFKYIIKLTKKGIL